MTPRHKVGDNILAGKAFVFDNSTGDLLFQIPNPNPQTDGFGTSVAAVGEDFLIGSGNSAYLFDGGSGTLLHTFAPEASVGGEWGRYVAAAGDKILIGFGERQGFPPDPGDGLLYIYSTATFDFVTKAKLAGRHQYRLMSVADFDGQILVGSADAGSNSTDPFDSDEAGMVYVIDGQSGDVTMTIPNPYVTQAATYRNDFGKSVAHVGNNIFVGDPNGADADGNGIVYMFDGVPVRFQKRDHASSWFL